MYLNTSHHPLPPKPGLEGLFIIFGSFFGARNPPTPYALYPIQSKFLLRNKKVVF